MNTSDEPPARDRLAIALSIAAHACALGLLAVLLGDRFIPLSSDTDSGTAAFITTIEHRMRAGAAPVPHPRIIRPAPAQLAERPATPAPAPQQRQRSPNEPPAATPKTRSMARSDLNHTGTPAARHPGTFRRPTLALVEPTELPAPIPTTAATTKPAIAAATPSPASEVSRSPAAVSAANFGGLFSADYPPALSEPSDAAEIRALLGGPARIRIDVDETGRATDVRFIVPLSDPRIEQAVRDKLLALRYVPADCNGLHCDGTLELRL